MLPESAIKELGGTITSDRLNSKEYVINVSGKIITSITAGFFDLHARKQELKAFDIGKQIISPTHHLFMYSSDPSISAKVAAVQNESLYKIHKEMPAQFLINATLPLNDTRLALQELEKAYSKFEISGVEIGTNIGGKNLDNVSLYSVYEKLQELSLPVFVHPNDVMGGERLSKYYMAIVIGTLAETTVAFTSALFGGIFQQFPKLRFIFCHGGGAVPYQIGRIMHALKVRNEVKDKGITLENSLKNIYWDTVLFDNESLNFLIKKFGDDHVVAGTDYPFNMGDFDSIKKIEELKQLTKNSRRSILYNNAAKLYNLH
ncbi:MAG: amidohydrolase family protein [Nitrososphaeria archaeon]